MKADCKQLSSTVCSTVFRGTRSLGAARKDLRPPAYAGKTRRVTLRAKGSLPRKGQQPKAEHGTAGKGAQPLKGT
jgi:hypothetical protein